jgi:Zinc carboxypeptidase
MSLRRKAALAVAVAALAAGAAPSVSHAQTAGCTQTIGYDASIPTWDQYWAAHPDQDAVTPLGWGKIGSGGGTSSIPNQSGAPGEKAFGRNLTRLIYAYWDNMVAVTANATGTQPKVIKKYLGRSASGLRDIQFYAVGTAEHLANLDAPGGDAEFWRGVRSGQISEELGLEAAATRPAFAWITATPHGGESAAAEAITRQLYELMARTDCENTRRLALMDYFMMPIRNPDGRDAVTRTTAWGFDPNRDFGTQNQQENKVFIPQMNNYPGVFYIDAHQTSSGYFFPPNEDPVHHEISHFALDFIQNGIGPALQDAFNAQSIAFRNYSQYDLFTPEYGDTIPSLVMGAAGMTYEKGTSEAYAKQVYDHYVAIDTTIKATVEDKVGITSRWVAQWKEAVDQGANCQLQPNTLVSPLHDTLKQNPQGTVCGYFFKPDQHTGDTAALIDTLQGVGVRVFKLDTPVAVNGYHEFGNSGATGTPNSVNGQTLPAGTLWIPMDQGMKHYIQAVLGENPFIPYDYYYDVVTWSYPLQRGLAGSGFLTQRLSPGIQMTEVNGTNYGTAPTDASPVYAFNTDSARGLALAVDLLDKGVNVYRGVQSFTTGGKQFYTGAALVDGASLAGSSVGLAGLATLAAKRDTPVTGLPGYPVQRRQLSVPKIGLYTGLETIPSNPLFPEGPNVSGTTRHCALTSGGAAFCEAMHDLAVKLELPISRIVPVTSADLAADKLSTDGFTAFINPGSSIATTSGTPPVLTPIGTALQKFINNGGVYVGTDTNGASAARAVGATTLDTAPSADYSGLNTPGATFDATFETTNPVAWGFDLGGWIYRNSTGNPVFDPAKLGNATPVVKYGVTPDEKYGYETNGFKLDTRPAVVDAPSGTGRAVLIGFNPFYRSWKEQDERLVLNAALYPKGAALEPSPATRESAQPAPTAAEIRAAPAAAPKATTTGRAGVKAPAISDRDLRIQVKRADAAKLKAAVKAAHLSKSVKRKLKYSTTKKTVTLVIKGVRTSDEHARKAWVSRLRKELDRRKVTPVYALV